MIAIRLLALALAAALSPVGGRAAGVCDAGCAPDDALCRTAESLCETKIRAFDVYMKYIDAGRPKYELPAIHQGAPAPPLSRRGPRRGPILVL